MPNPMTGSKSHTPAEMELQDYLRIVGRRKSWIAITAVAMFTATLVVIVRLPDEYRAQTVILVDPQKVPDTFVPSTVTASIVDRLSTIQEQVTSPSRLKQMIEKMNLYPELRQTTNLQDVVVRMQKSISVETVEGGGYSRAFRIVFRGRRPIEVAQVANQLARMFIEENVKVREQQSYDTADFLESELQKTQQQLKEKEAELSEVKAKHTMELPESKQFHLEALNNLRYQLRESQDRIARAQQEKAYLRSMMSSSAPTIDLDAEGTTASPFQRQLERLESKLADLRAHYGESYPEVRKVQHDIDVLSAKIAKEQKNRPPDATPTVPVPSKVRNPVIEAQVQQLDQEIEKQTKMQKPLEDQIQFHMSRLEQVPVFEQRIAGLMRDYDTLRTHYIHLLDKKLSADTASALETRQKGERFVILDPAQVPSRPYSPNRLLLSLAALVGGLAGGIGLAVLIDFGDTTVHDEQDIVRMIGNPVLALVPQIETPREHLRGRMVGAVTLLGSIAGSGAIGYVLSFFTNRFM